MSVSLVRENLRGLKENLKHKIRSIDKCRPDLLITESTYATTIRDSKRCRERDFLKKVHDCVEKGGKVLIPVFALGRAQELCILLESYWERMNLKVPVFFR